MLRIFSFNNKKLLNLSFILTLQFFEGQGHKICHKIIWHTSNVKKSEFKLKNTEVSKPLLFFIYFFR